VGAVCASFALAQASEKYPLETLKVTGNKHVPTAKILAVVALPLGRAVNKEDFDAARQRLIGSGAFLNVGYEFKPSASNKGYDAVIEIAELMEFFPYVFQDMPVKDEVLRSAFKGEIFENEIPVTEAVMRRYVDALERQLGGNVKVSGKLGHPDNSKEFAVIFSPIEARPSIAQVQFTGNSVIPEDVLINTFAQAAIGVPYTEAEVQRRLDSSIRPLYEARGRIRVSFPKVSIVKAERVNGVVVNVTVNEAEVYNLGDLRFPGVPSAQATTLARVADLKKGDIANFDDVKAGLDRIHKRYKDDGYLHVSEKVERQVNDQAHTVDLAISIEPGDQYHFGKLKIEGLDLFSEPEIRKMWGNREGQPFNADFPDAFLARIRNDDLFDNLGKSTRAETNIDEKTKIADVTLYFAGEKPEEREERLKKERRRRESQTP
jgi:outer membrane protein insertion porin family